MSEAGARLLAVAWTAGWYEGQLDLDRPFPAHKLVSFLFREYKLVVTPAWANEIQQGYRNGLQ